MKPFFILLGLSICVISLSAQEAYQYNQFYYQRATLFEKLPIDSDDIVFLGNSITNGCEWHELFNNALCFKFLSLFCGSFSNGCSDCKN